MNEQVAPLTPEEEAQLKRGPIAWFARNPVAANLLMLFIICSGIFSAVNIPRTMMPNFEVNWVQVQLLYPGATPEEIEQSMVVKVEEAVREVEGIKGIVSRSSHSNASVQLEVETGYDVNDVQSEIKSAVDSIATLPADSEKPIVSRLPVLRHVISLELSSNEVDYKILRELADDIKLQLLTDPLISRVDLYGSVDYEISIEVDEHILRKYELTLSDVAEAVGRSALDLPGGVVRTESGNILLQTKGRSYRQKDFEQIVLLSFDNGTRIHVGDVATVRDDFVEGDYISRLNGRTSVSIAPQSYDNQDVVDIARAAREYAERIIPTLPQGVYLDMWSDVSHYLQGRIDMMRKNLFLGMMLVFLILILFMDIKLAFWVMMGIPISFLGAYAVMPLDPFGVTINLLSLFAFIMVLGIVVDDAIIIGESSYNVCEERGHSIDSVIYGAQRIVVPAVFGVLTTVIAFSPTLFVTGPFSSFPKEIGFVVLLCLLFSMLESKLILPAHLAHTKPSTAGWLAPLRSLQAFCNHLLSHYVINGFYRKFLATCIRNRYTVIAGFISILILSVGLVTGGIVRVVLTDSPPGDFIQVTMRMAAGAPSQQMVDHMEYMEDELMEMDEEHQAATGKSFLQFVNLWNDLDAAYLFVELLAQEERNIGAEEVMNQWRERVGALPGTKSLAFSNAEGGPEFHAISLTLKGTDRDKLDIAAGLVLDKLHQYEGVYDIRSDVSDLRDELHIQLRPEAERLGLSLAAVGSQVRHAFYGYEVQRIQRGNDEIKVMVRYPKEDRTNLATLQYMPIKTPAGGYVTFSSVAEVEVRPSAASLVRSDGASAIDVTAETNKDVVAPSAIVDLVLAEMQPLLQDRYQINIAASASSESETELLSFLIVGFIMAMFANYAFIAMPLRSYAQPAIIMFAIPFCMIGALLGHLIMSIPVSMLSLFGIIAASGVVVNDGLILADFINKARAKGSDIVDAVIDAGSMRYRAIMLTSLTTFFGLLPIMIERSAQARFVVPMAISLSFGVLFATMVTLFLLPCMYVALHDGKHVRRRFTDIFRILWPSKEQLGQA